MCWHTKSKTTSASVEQVSRALFTRNHRVWRFCHCRSFSRRWVDLLLCAASLSVALLVFFGCAWLLRVPAQTNKLLVLCSALNVFIQSFQKKRSLQSLWHLPSKLSSVSLSSTCFRQRPWFTPLCHWRCPRASTMRLILWDIYVSRLPAPRPRRAAVASLACLCTSCLIKWRVKHKFWPEVSVRWVWVVVFFLFFSSSSEWTFLLQML